MFITYILTLLCGAAITHSISSEKINRIIDILAYKVSPSMIIFSKVLAVLTLCFQLIAILLLEVLLFNMLGVISTDFLFEIFQELNIVYVDGLLVCLFAFLGCFMYTLLYAISGIFVSSQEQQQFAPLPVTIMLFLSIGVAFYSFSDMDGLLFKYSMYVPFIAPFTVPGILMSENYQYWELIISMSIFFSFLGGITWLINKVILPRKIN